MTEKESETGKAVKPKATEVEDKDVLAKDKAALARRDPNAIIDPQTGEAISSTNEPDETGSTSGIPPIGPTDMDGDGEPDAGVEEGQAIKDAYTEEVDARKADAERRGSQAPNQQGPEGRRRVASLAEALYPDENVSDEAKQAVAPKADASHA